jgi:hypothetical protein
MRADSPDLASARDRLAVSARQVVVIGEVAGALQGWPLVLDGGGIAAWAQAADGRPLPTSIGQPEAGDECGLDGAVRLKVVAQPAGTTGFQDLWRGSEVVATPTAEIRVASLVDLLRIADASTGANSRRQALVHQAVLDVRRSRERHATMSGQTDAERIETWLSQQKPVAR